MKPFITNTAKSIRNKRLGVLGGIGVLGASGLIA
jgi:cobalamin biosynthesis protein CbiD